MKKKLLSVLLAAVMAGSLTACGSGTETPAKDTGTVPADAGTEAATQTTEAAAAEAEVKADGDYEIYFISKTGASPYWQTVAMGAEQAGKDLGIKVTILAPNAETEIDKQISMVEQAVNAGADGITLAPLDVNSLIQPCADVMKAGIPLTLVDSLIDSEDYNVAFATDNYAAGEKAADELAKQLGEKGKIFVINAVAGSQACIQREEGFRAKIADYKDIEMVGETIYCNDDKITAANQAIDTLAAHPDLNAFYAPNENAGVGVANGVKEAGKAGEIIVAMFDSSDDSIALMQEGTIQIMVCQSPYNMGYMGVEGALKLAKGETMEHGINDTGSVIVTKENKDSEEVQKLWYPLGK